MRLGTMELPTWPAPTVAVQPDRIAAGEEARVMVKIAIPDGCHIQSHQPGDPFLIPTQLLFDAMDDLAVSSIDHPVEHVETFDWSPVVLRVHRGTVEIVAKVVATATAGPGPRTITGRIRYQGCTENACLPPAEHAFEVVLDIE